MAAPGMARGTWLLPYGTASQDGAAMGSRCLHHCDCPEGAMGEAQEISLESKGLGESLHYSRKQGSVLTPPGKPYTKGFYFCRHTSNLRG